MRKLHDLIGLCLLSLALVSSPVLAKQDKEKDLPPGLQKKAAKGQALPPGWQKKLAKGQKLDQQIVDQGKVVQPLDKNGIIIIEVDGKVISLFKATREIIDILK